MILNGAGENLRRAGRTGVDQHDHRDVGRHAAPFDAEGLPIATCIFLLQNIPALQELTGHTDGLLQQTTRVVAHIKDQTFCTSRLCRFQRRHQFALGRGAKLIQTHQGRLRAGYHCPRHRRHLDLAAHQGQLDARIFAFAQEGQHHFGAGGTAHPIHDLIQRQAGHIFAIDAKNNITGADARFRSRRVVNRRDNHGQAFLDPQLGADAAKAAGHGGLLTLQFAGRQKGGVSFIPQRLHQPIDGAVG